MSNQERILAKKAAAEFVKKQAAKRNRQILTGVATAAGLIALPFVVFVAMIGLA